MVAFRGTDPLSIFDYLTDVKVTRRVTRWGRIHHGFMDALDLEDIGTGESAFSLVLAAIERHQSYHQGVRLKKVYFTGHSLGGALATCAVMKLIELKRQDICDGLYTYGMPMVGDSEFANNFDRHYPGKCFRFVHNDDAVPRLPPSTHVFPNANRLLFWILSWISIPKNYAHVGREVFLDTRGNMKEMLDPEQLSTRSYLKRAIILGKVRELFYGMIQPEPLLRKIVRVFLPPFFNDHFPGDYVRSMRKARIKKKRLQRIAALQAIQRAH